MHRAIQFFATTALAAVVFLSPVQAGVAGEYEVVGVEAEDMLKMRSGPGIGYRIIVGLPNGALVRVQSCEQSGSTRWCKVSLKQARGLKGYVSAAYLRKL
ncbi:SH3 domain-containing protein [Xinfangfangia sp. D13-10-4-6]|uniref:SH3 domain-containing protein n=1 Tax=Pseudogemmobacter hezensis TaxID=2737662 RepID=UPI0015559ADD|nr:SH3 domain-containing protein [Pseudogemmobacter hezensis]NPD15982.1 SH3 domain-containing protein [Pseudogemmobacter hezensis]